MKALTAAARGICYMTAEAHRPARSRRTEAERAADAHERASLLTPVAKAFSTDIGVEVASLGVQVHGGMGYHRGDRRGAAPARRAHRRRSTRAPTASRRSISSRASCRSPAARPSGRRSPRMRAIAQRLVQGARRRLRPDRAAPARRDREPRPGDELSAEGAQRATRPRQALAGATPYLRLFALAQGGAALAEAALAATPR